MIGDPILDVHDIQGNILAGFNKDVQIVLGLVIDDVAGAKRWLSAIQGHVSSTYEVLHFNRLFRSIRARTRREPAGLASTGMNLAFSHDGLRKLTTSAEADAVPDLAFRNGMPARASAILGDPIDAASPYHPTRWKTGGPGQVPDVLVIVASDLEALAQSLVDTLLAAGPATTALRVVYREVGTTRRDRPGHEHFGFRDGISQPGVRGRASTRADDFVTPRTIDPEDPLAATFARPGQPLVMPGHYVLGYGTQDPSTGELQAPPALAQPWFRNGSFLVFRRLRQDVAAFRAFVAGAATAYADRVPGLTPERLAATFVGRWPDGAPLTRAPGGPDPAMETATAINAFAFANAMPAVHLRAGTPPDAAPPAPADPLALVCPHWAHIRKVNPRDDQTNLGDEFDTVTRRMLRRGIPYGPPFAPDAAADDGIDRGLLFLAYHASIEQSFEKVTADWVNQTETPSPRGHDPILGQTNAGGARTRVVALPAAAGPSVEMTLDREWVLPTGGGYFFAPSLSAIAGRLAGP